VVGGRGGGGLPLLRVPWGGGVGVGVGGVSGGLVLLLMVVLLWGGLAAPGVCRRLRLGGVLGVPLPFLLLLDRPG
jgi:hypothetical protein